MKYTESLELMILEFMILQKLITVGVICGYILVSLEFVNERIHPGIYCTFWWLYQKLNFAVQ